MFIVTKLFITQFTINIVGLLLLDEAEVFLVELEEELLSVFVHKPSGYDFRLWCVTESNNEVH